VPCRSGHMYAPSVIPATCPEHLEASELAGLCACCCPWYRFGLTVGRANGRCTGLVFGAIAFFLFMLARVGGAGGVFNLAYQLSDMPGGCDPLNAYSEAQAKANAADAAILRQAAATTTARLPGTAWSEAIAIAGGTTAAAKTAARLPGTAWGEAMAIAGGTTAAAKTAARLPGTAWGEAMAIAGGTTAAAGVAARTSRASSAKVATAAPRAAAFVGFTRASQCQLYAALHRSPALLAGLLFVIIGALYRGRLRRKYKIQVHARSRHARSRHDRRCAESTCVWNMALCRTLKLAGNVAIGCGAVLLLPMLRHCAGRIYCGSVCLPPAVL